MSRSNLLPNFFLPPNAVSLGRFVTSFDEPHHDFHDPPCSPGPDVIEKVHIQYDSNHDAAKQRVGASRLTGLLSSSFSKRLESSLRVTANEAKTYYLNNVGQWFRTALEHEETRKWIERNIDGGEDIYMVVAYHTLQDSRIAEHLQEQRFTGGQVTVPVSTALTASGVVIPFTAALDPGLSGSRGLMQNEKWQFIAPGEQVYAVQYREVKWAYFSSKKVDKATLAKKTWWESYNKPRSTELAVHDCMEVGLEDEDEMVEDIGESEMVLEQLLNL
jgi:hypothetical protein